MKRIEAKPKGVPNFIWEMYEESWTDYNSEVGRQQLATTRGGHYAYELRQAIVVANLGLLERIMRHMTVSDYTGIKDIFEYHRKLDEEERRNHGNVNNSSHD